MLNVQSVLNLKKVKSVKVYLEDVKVRGSDTFIKSRFCAFAFKVCKKRCHDPPKLILGFKKLRILW